MYVFNLFLFVLVSTIYPWSNGLFAVFSNKHKIHKVNPENGNSITVLPGYHRNAPVYLTSMHATMSPSGLISSIGQNMESTAATISCNILISVGKGCKGPLQSYSQLSNTTLDNTYAILHVHDNLKDFC